MIFVPPTDLPDPATLPEAELREEIKNRKAAIAASNDRIEYLNKQLDKMAGGSYDAKKHLVFTERNSTGHAINWAQARIDLLEKQALIKYTVNVRLRRFAAAFDIDGIIAALKDGANINCYDVNLNTPLMLATQSGCVDLLMKKGANVNAQNNQGQTALHLAVLNSRVSVVKTILSWECDKNIKDSRGSSPLALAVLKGDNECIRLLGGTPLANSSYSSSANSSAPSSSATSTVLLNNSLTPLALEAAKTGNIDNVVEFIKRGADPLPILHELVKVNETRDLEKLLSDSSVDFSNVTTSGRSSSSILASALRSSASTKVLEQLMMLGFHKIDFNNAPLPIGHYCYEDYVANILRLINIYNTEKPQNFTLSTTLMDDLFSYDYKFYKETDQENAHRDRRVNILFYMLANGIYTKPNESVAFAKELYAQATAKQLYLYTQYSSTIARVLKIGWGELANAARCVYKYTYDTSIGHNAICKAILCLDAGMPLTCFNDCGNMDRVNINICRTMLQLLGSRGWRCPLSTDKNELEKMGDGVMTFVTIVTDYDMTNTVRAEGFYGMIECLRLGFDPKILLGQNNDRKLVNLLANVKATTATRCDRAWIRQHPYLYKCHKWVIKAFKNYEKWFALHPNDSQGFIKSLGFDLTSSYNPDTELTNILAHIATIKRELSYPKVSIFVNNISIPKVTPPKGSIYDRNGGQRVTLAGSPSAPSRSGISLLSSPPSAAVVHKEKDENNINSWLNTKLQEETDKKEQEKRLAAQVNLRVSSSVSSPANPSAAASPSDKSQDHAFFLACNEGNITEAQKLCAAGVDVNYSSGTYGLGAPLSVVLKNNTAVLIDMLLAHPRINVNIAGDMVQSTALHWAACCGRYERFSQLVKLGVRVNAVDINGMTALHEVLTYKRISGAKALLDIGADPLLRTSRQYNDIPAGSDAFDIAKQYGVADQFNQLFKSNDRSVSPSRISAVIPPPRPVHVAVDINKALYQVCKNDDDKGVQQYIDEGANINYAETTEEGRTPLLVALEHKNSRVIHLLLNQTALDVNLRDIKQRSPVGYAAHILDTAVLTKLIARGANVNAANWVDETPLHLALCVYHMDHVEILVQAGANTAVKIGYPYKQHPANCSLRDMAIKLGVGKRYDDIVSAAAIASSLVSISTRPVAPPPVPVASVATPAATSTSTAMSNGALLYKACVAGNLDEVKRLTGSLVDVNYQESTDSYKTPLLAACLHYNEAVIRHLLLQPGINPNKNDENNRSALEWAVYMEESGAVELLITKGANVNNVNWVGITPLHLTATCDNAQIAKILIKAGAHRGLRTKEEFGEVPANSTAYDIAKARGKLALYDGILDIDTNPQTVSSSTEVKVGSVSSVNARSKAKAGSQLRVSSGNTGSTSSSTASSRGSNTSSKSASSVKMSGSRSANLYAACRDGNLVSIRRLLADGAYINYQEPSEKNQTPILIALEKGHKEIVNLLLEHPQLDINRCGDRKHTVLELSVAYCDEVLVRTIIKLGANVDGQNKYGCTALHIALILGSIPVIKSLLDHGARTDIKTIRGIPDCPAGTTAIELASSTGVDFAALLPQTRPAQQQGSTKPQNSDQHHTLVELTELRLSGAVDCSVLDKKFQAISHDYSHSAEFFAQWGHVFLADYRKEPNKMKRIEIKKKALEKYRRALSISPQLVIPEYEDLQTGTVILEPAPVSVPPRPPPHPHLLGLRQRRLQHRLQPEPFAEIERAFFSTSGINYEFRQHGEHELEYGHLYYDEYKKEKVKFRRGLLKTKALERYQSAKSYDPTLVIPEYDELTGTAVPAASAAVVAPGGSNPSSPTVLPSAFALTTVASVPSPAHPAASSNPVASPVRAAVPLRTLPKPVLPKTAKAEMHDGTTPSTNSTAVTTVSDLVALRRANSLPVRELNQRYVTAEAQHSTNPDFYVEYGHLYYDSYTREQDEFRRGVLRGKALGMYEKAITLDPFLPDIAEYQELKQ